MRDVLADALVDALNQPMLLGADIMSEALNLLATDMEDDGRALLFWECIKEEVIAFADNLSKSVDASSNRASETAVDVELNLVEVNVPNRFRTMLLRLQQLSCRHQCAVVWGVTLASDTGQSSAGWLEALPFHVSFPGGCWRKRLRRSGSSS